MLLRQFWPITRAQQQLRSQWDFDEKILKLTFSKALESGQQKCTKRWPCCSQGEGQWERYYHVWCCFCCCVCVSFCLWSTSTEFPLICVAMEMRWLQWRRWSTHQVWFMQFSVLFLQVWWSIVFFSVGGSSCGSAPQSTSILRKLFFLVWTDVQEIALKNAISKPALRSFLTMVQKHSSRQESLFYNTKVIVLSYLDSGYLDLAENRQVTFRKFGIDNYLFVTPNSETVRELEKRGMRGVALWEDDKSTTRAIDYGSKDWGKKVTRKLPIGEVMYLCFWKMYLSFMLNLDSVDSLCFHFLDCFATSKSCKKCSAIIVRSQCARTDFLSPFSVALALMMNVTVIHMDIDIVLLKNPFPYLHHPMVDFVVSKNRKYLPQWNSGILSFLLSDWTWWTRLVCHAWPNMEIWTRGCCWLRFKKVRKRRNSWLWLCLFQGSIWLTQPEMPRGWWQQQPHCAHKNNSKSLGPWICHVVWTTIFLLACGDCTKAHGLADLLKWSISSLPVINLAWTG